ncbi:MAG: thiaminase II [Chlamydiales bacterium]|nr:thiaminase II [Chlamydiales bacterium]
MKFSECLWETTIPIYQQIIQHPFNIELAEGTLNQKKFIFYMEQDSYYLIHFSRALACIAAKATSSTIIHHFLNFSLGALVAERELHAGFLPSSYNSDEVEPSPSCMAYTQYLMATASTASLEETIAAVLPCFWIYREVGRHIANRCIRANPYIKWIETYSSQEFSDGTDRAISLLDELANQCSDRTRERMKRAFEYSSLFEWHFWDDAYKMMIFRDSVKESDELFIKVGKM